MCVCMYDPQFEKLYFITTVGTLRCTEPQTRHLEISLIFMFYILALYIPWLMFGVMISRLESIIST